MVRRTAVISALALMLALSSLAGCPEGDAPSGGTDSAAETDTSAATDVTADAGPDDTGALDVAVDAASDSATGSDSDAGGGVTCDHQGFTAAAENAFVAFGALTYLGQSTTGAPVDTLNIELYPDLGGPTAAGSYPVDGSNYSECGTCVLIWVGCDDNLANCAKTFYGVSGTVNISTYGASGGQFTGSLEGVELVEVTLDDQSNSTVVPGGETWCLDSYLFDVAVQ